MKYLLARRMSKRQVWLVFRTAEEVSEVAIRNLISDGLAGMIAAYIGEKFARNHVDGIVVNERHAIKAKTKSRPDKDRKC